jgi:hypothetical protein
MRARTDAWESWFAGHPDPQVRASERFLYLIDESPDDAQTQAWASWIENNPGPGRNLMSLATTPATSRTGFSPPAARPRFAHETMPALDIAASWIAVGVTADWEEAAAHWRTESDKRLFMYNGIRPATGSFAIEDDGVALRQLAWAQHKLGVDRWFFWESTYYDNFQGGTGQTDVFATAHTFGGLAPTPHPPLGRTGWNYSNGDGVLFYPGTDRVFPASSLEAPGPIASLRMKHWRRGIQDVEYLTLAAAVDPDATREIVVRLVPEAIWEVGTAPPAADPESWFTWLRADVSWSNDPAVWEQARGELAAIILAGGNGTGDLIWVDDRGAAAVWLNGDSTTTRPLGGGGGWTLAATGDFNADGVTDLVWRDPTGIHVAWLMNSVGATLEKCFLGGGGGWELAATGDYDGDGRTDLVWRHGPSGANVMWLMNGTTVESISLVRNAGVWRLLGRPGNVEEHHAGDWKKHAAGSPRNLRGTRGADAPAGDHGRSAS